MESSANNSQLKRKKHSRLDHSRMPTLNNPFEREKPPEFKIPGSIDQKVGVYEAALREGHELIQRPQQSVPAHAVQRQHQKGRMTVWERMTLLSDKKPMVFHQNWGEHLDGASLVTAIISVDGRDIAFYGHDFTQRAGSMDTTNGRKLAALFKLAGEKGIPVIGINDSAGAYVPAGVGGLDGYAASFAGLRNISGVVPSIMCMFGFNAGGGAYLPRQGSFLIQPNETFIGLTGTAVVKSVLGEDVTPDELGGPGVHGQSGVSDFVVEDEAAALMLAKRLLTYLPDNHRVPPPFRETADPISRKTWSIDVLLKNAFNSPTGYNTPVDIGVIIQQICDHGDYFEVQPQRAQNTVCAFARLGGHVVGFVANNSAVSSGQIDYHAALKNARFIRFCNLYNIPVIFIEDTTGFVPGTEQEKQGIIQAGRAMLDAIVDLRTPRILLIIRNAFGGAYATYNNYSTGADLVLALPTTRLAVMGPAGKEFVYKSELTELRKTVKKRAKEIKLALIDSGMAEQKASERAEQESKQWLQLEEAKLSQQYEKQFMNPKEALSLGSISQIVMPSDLRQVLGEHMQFFLRRYKAEPMQSTQREFH